MSINPLPPNTQALVPYMTIKNCAKAMEFYKKVFMAKEVSRMHAPDGKQIMHAEMQIGGCMVYMSDEMPEMGCKSPTTLGATPVGMTLYCLDAEKVFKRAVKHGAKVAKPMMDMFWGDRMGTVIDPFGHMWTMLQRVEELSEAEVAKRAKVAMASKN